MVTAQHARAITISTHEPAPRTFGAPTTRPRRIVVRRTLASKSRRIDASEFHPPVTSSKRGKRSSGPPRRRAGRSRPSWRVLGGEHAVGVDGEADALLSVPLRLRLRGP